MISVQATACTENQGFAYIGTDPLPKALVRVVSQFHIIQKPCFWNIITRTLCYFRR